MPNITEIDLKNQIKSKEFKRAYFIYGEEKYLVDYYTKLLTDKILLGSNNSFNLQDFTGTDFNADIFHNAVESFPLMAPIKCVRLFDLDVEKQDQNTIKNLKEIISDIPDTTVIIISQPGIYIDRKRSSKWNSFINFFEKHGETLNLQLLSKQKLQKQLIKWAERLFCKLSSSNAQKIIDKCGDNLLILKQEMEKLCSYASKSEITSEDIDAVVVENFEANMFELTKAVTFGNYKKAFELLDILLYKREEPTAILSILSSAYIDMYRVKTAEQSGKSLNEIAEVFDYKRKMFRLENAQRYAKRMSIETIRNCIDLIAQTDAELKSSKIESKILLEELITKLSVIC